MKTPPSHVAPTPTVRRSQPSRLAALGLALAALLGGRADAGIVHETNGFLFSGTYGSVLVNDTNGSLLALSTGTTALATGGEAGLWSVSFGTNTFGSATGSLNAAAFSSGSSSNTFAWSLPAPSNVLYLTYSNADLTVSVTLSNRDDGVEMAAAVAPRVTNVLMLTFPARLRFDPAEVERFVAPSHTSDGVGTAYTPQFFEIQDEETPASWNRLSVGPAAYLSLYGAGCDANEIYTPTSLTITADGGAWLGNSLSNEYAAASAVVHRPPAAGQWDVVLIDSPRGPFFSGSHLPHIGGTTNSGWLMRLGGLIDPSRVEFALDIVVAAIEHLAQTAGGRTNVAVVNMARGPAIGESWPSEVPIYDWVDRLEASTNLAALGIRVSELASFPAMTNALAATNYLAILNPYGELVPGSLAGGVAATATNIGQYVVAGGSWFEVAGYSFYQWLQPELYYAIGLFYPPVFADFLQLETTHGNAAIYGVQPVQTTPANAWSTNAAELFVPGQLVWGADAAGGYCQRGFGTYVATGQTWQSPKVRISLGQSAAGALQDYAGANQLSRGLTNKMDAATLDKLRRSILVHYVYGGEETPGVATQLTAHLSQLPSPSLIHFSQYLWGGFDKLYPDLLNPTNLDPAAHFGTAAEFTNFLAQAKAGGHLTMPYTNPTFWSDPAGPTALAGGPGARQLNLDGTYSFENYFGNGGYNVTPWHPAVRAASTNTLNDFRTTYPVDVLFQDQIGARTWQYDLNTSSPTPYAYMGGIIARAGEDSGLMPVSTENGYDRLANYEAQFCGLAWGLVPTPNAPSWRRFLRDRYATWTWNVFPVAQYLAHDKVLMNYNDLSASVATHEVIAWTLGLGYGTTYRIEAPDLDQVATRQWLLWVDRVQKSVISRYAGQGINAFSHAWGTNAVDPDNGVISASYGPVTVVGNLGLENLTTNGWTLPAHGYLATATGLRAAHYVPAGGTEPVAYVAETNGSGGVDFWIHSVGDRAAKIVLPPGFNGQARVQLDGYAAVPRTIASDTLTVSLGSSGTNALLWHGTMDLAGTQAVYLVDCGRHDSGTNGLPTASPDYNGNTWNNFGPVLTTVTNGSKLLNLVDTTNGASGIGFEITSGGWAANGILNGGLLTPSPALLGLFAVTNATMDYIFTTVSDTFKLTGLNTARVYNLEFFGTRSNTATRTSTYTVGTNSVSLTTSGAGIGAGGVNWNNNTTAVLRALAPNASGEISVTVSVAAGGFAYVGILKIEQVLPPAADGPVILPSATSLSFAATNGGPNPASQTFAITNSGSAALNYTLSTNAGWVSVSPVTGSLAAGAGQQITVSVTTTGLQPGTSNATITVNDPAATNSPQAVSVSLVLDAAPAPAIQLTPSSLSFASTNGGANPPAQTFALTNTGSGTLNFSLATNANWLSASPATGSLAAGAGQQVTVSIDNAGLSAGTSNATITVSDPAATNSPQTVSVSLAISGASLAVVTQEVILVDFGNNSSYRGTNVLNPDPNGRYWNSVYSGAFYTDLVNQSNTATAVDLGFDAATGTDSFNGPGGSFDSAALGALGVTNAVNDYYVSARFQLQGLDTSRTYRLTFFGSHKYSTDTNTIYAVHDDNNYTQALASATLAVQTPGSPALHNSNTVAVLTNLAPRSNGRLYVEFEGDRGNEGYLNAMMIEALSVSTGAPPASGATTQAVYLVDCGRHDSGTNGLPTASPDYNGNTWNNFGPVLTTVTNGSTLLNLVDTTNGASSIGFEITSGGWAANGILNGGLLTPSPALLGLFAVTNATMDYIFTTVSDTFKLTGLNTARVYNLEFFGTRSNTATRTSTYTVGTNSVSLTTSGAGIGAGGADFNNNTTAVLRALAPNASGEIPVTVSVAAGGFAYVGILKIEEVYLPPSTGAAPSIAASPVQLIFSTAEGGANPVAQGFGLTNTGTAVLNYTISTNAGWLSVSPASGSLAAGAGQQLSVSINNTGLQHGSSNATVTITDSAAGNSPQSVSVRLNILATNSVVTVFGSSVAKGWNSSGHTADPDVLFNGSWSNGYAYLIAKYLADHGGFYVTNASTPGDNTAAGITKFPTYVVPTAPHYVLLGYSLGNEGLAGTTDPSSSNIVATFTANLLNLVGLCRSNGFTPVIGSVYPRGDFTASNYDYLKQMHLAINAWNVPSLNLLTPLDDGTGKWVAGFWSDGAHPNDTGYAEFYYAFVPSLFAAIEAGRTNSPAFGSSTNYARVTRNAGVTAPLTFTPSNTVHSFTTAFRVRTSSTGTIAAVRSGADYSTLEIRASQLVYVTRAGSETVLATNLADGAWHDVALSSRYALSNTAVYVDGVLAGSTPERYAPDQFILGGPGASGRAATPAIADFDTWCVYRAGWTVDEALAQKSGSLQQSSMEIAAMLDDGAFTNGAPLANSAQSLSEAVVNTPDLAAWTPEMSASPRLLIFGSSVAKGWNGGGSITNGSYALGYAGRLTPVLEGMGWTVTNGSVGGNTTTSLLARFDSDAVPVNPEIILIGLSLGNEGLLSDPDAAYESFRSGMTNLIHRSRTNGFYPVVTHVYPHTAYNTNHYAYVRRMNLLLNSWDLPGVNMLGPLDDGTGKWVTAYRSDDAHPNTDGHEEMFYALVPTLFDAIQAGRTNTPQLAGTYGYARLQGAQPRPFTFTPEHTMHSFNAAFRVRAGSTGTVAAVMTSTGAPAASPATFLVDFGRHDGGTHGNATVSPDVNGNYWNNLSPANATTNNTVMSGDAVNNMVTISNVATSARIEITSSGWAANGRLNGGLLSPSNSLLGKFAIGTATEDYFFHSTTGTFKIAGLTPSSTYKLRFFGTRQSAETRIATFTVGSSSTNHQTSGTGIGTYAVDQNDDEIAELSGLSPSGSGEIAVSVARAGLSFAHLGILEIIETPGTNLPAGGTIEVRGDALVYVATNGSEIAATVDADGGAWIDVALSHSYARGLTMLYVDGVLAGTTSERLVPVQFALGGPGWLTDRPVAPATVDLQDWCVYRAPWTADEAMAQHTGAFQQASLELCAPLDDATFPQGGTASNRAQSLSQASIAGTNATSGPVLLPPGNLQATSPAYNTASLTWSDNSGTESGFVVERRPAGGSAFWSDRIVLAANATNYMDYSVAAGTYEYRVSAQEDSLQSDYAGPAPVAVADAPFPSAVPVAAFQFSGGKPGLSFVGSNAVVYALQFSTNLLDPSGWHYVLTSGAPVLVIGNGTSTDTLSDTNLADRTRVYRLMSAP
jgi:lysophospholipase L1-like esterase